MFISKTFPILAVLISTTQMSTLPVTPAPNKDKTIKPQTTIDVALNAVIHAQNAENEALKQMTEQKNPLDDVKKFVVPGAQAKYDVTRAAKQNAGLEMVNYEEGTKRAHTEPHFEKKDENKLVKLEDHPSLEHHTSHVEDTSPIFVPYDEFFTPAFGSKEIPPNLSLEIRDLIDAELANYTGRTMPPELAVYIDKKSGEADLLQDCMQEFTFCLRAHKSYPFCGQRGKEIRKFENICEMAYFNCKLSTEEWHFLQDGSCDASTEDKGSTTPGPYE